MNEAKEEIKARLAVEDVVGQYIELKRTGRTLKGRSPWGVDKTPSFMVSPEKGIWHDFSANRGGDIFSFIMVVEGVDFKTALEKLAQQAGVDLAKYDKGDREVVRRRARILEALELATKFYQLCLVKNAEAVKYVFYKRRMNRGTVQKFKIGYAPKQGKVLVGFLKKRGFLEAEIREAGLMNQYGGDLFRGRMMVPFMDTVGRVIGFTGRIIGEGEPKYLNTPETLVFNKGRFIFGLTQAKEAILKNGFVVVVEGNMDVISSHQAGVAEAVATSGTAMTEMHLKALKRLTSDVRLAYDGDSAGVVAAERAVKIAGGMGMSLAVIDDYRGAKDPDELIARGAEIWKEVVAGKRPAIDWLLDKYEEELDLTSGEGKRIYSDVAMELIREINDSVERSHYENLVARRLGVTVEDLRAKKLDEGRRRVKQVKGGIGREVLRGVEDDLLAILLYGGEAGKKVELLAPEDEVKKQELLLIFEEKYQNWGKERLIEEVKALNLRRKKELGRQKINKLQRELLESEEDEEKTKEILREITRIRGEMGVI